MTEAKEASKKPHKGLGKRGRQEPIYV